MSFEYALTVKLRQIFGTKWESRNGTVVPDAESVSLGKDAVRINGTVLYADLVESTQMVKGQRPEFAAEVYKAYLEAACRCIRHQGGVITSFDGDRVMAVFIGPKKNTSAVKAALNINWAVGLVNAQLKVKWTTDFVVRQRVGIDTGSLFVAKTGIRGSNDLVWVGTSANYAAKLCSMKEPSYTSWITASVYGNIGAPAKFVNKNGVNVDMWVPHYWKAQDVVVYKSIYEWKIS
jgi:class 3 adenylate cyclase